ncbi:MAG: hypothetical protein ACREAW_04075 [Nitrososphaera sp.]
MKKNEPPDTVEPDKVLSEDDVKNRLAAAEFDMKRIEAHKHDGVHASFNEV